MKQYLGLILAVLALGASLSRGCTQAKLRAEVEKSLIKSQQDLSDEKTKVSELVKTLRGYRLLNQTPEQLQAALARVVKKQDLAEDSVVIPVEDLEELKKRAEIVPVPRGDLAAAIAGAENEATERAARIGLQGKWETEFEKRLALQKSNKTMKWITGGAVVVAIVAVATK